MVFYLSSNQYGVFGNMDVKSSIVISLIAARIIFVAVFGSNFNKQILINTVEHMFRFPRRGKYSIHVPVLVRPRLLSH